MFPDHSENKLEINKNKISKETPYIWKLIDTFLNNPPAKKKLQEKCENIEYRMVIKVIYIPNGWMQLKQCLDSSLNYFIRIYKRSKINDTNFT